MTKGTRKNATGSIVERLKFRTDRSGECWLWTGGLSSAGYGWIKVNGRQQNAHRVAYEALVGPIPEGLYLDHLCRVRRCINPAHLEPVTNRENILRGVSLVAVNAAKTHCKRGHPFDDENTFVNSFGARVCRECKRERQRRYKAARRCSA